MLLQLKEYDITAYRTCYVGYREVVLDIAFLGNDALL